MGDRRPSLFSRFLASTAPPARRAPAAQTTARSRAPTTDTPAGPPPVEAQTTTRPRAPTTDTTPRPPSTKDPTTIPSTTSATPPNVEPKTPTSTTPPNVEPKTPTRRPTATTTSDPSTPSISPKPKGPMVDQPLANAIDAKTPPSSNELQRVDQPTDTTSSRSIEEPTKLLPSRTTTQSRSPPLPSSPSRTAPQVRSTPSSPSNVATKTTPSTPPRASPLRSPSHVASRSPKSTSSPSTMGPQPKSSSRESLTKSRSMKGTESPSPSKEPRRSSQETFNSNGEPTSIAKGPNMAEPLERPLVERPLVEVDNENKPHIEQNQNLDERNGVQELVQSKNNKTSDHNEIKKANDFLTQKSSYEQQAIEKAEIPRTLNHKPMINDEESLETKEILSPSLLNKNPINPKTNETPNRRTTNSDTHKHLSLHKDIKNGISEFSNQMAIADLKSDHNPSVLTLAGENRGAVMQIGSNASQREGPIHIHRGYKLNSTSNVDQGSDEGNKTEDAKGTEGDRPPEAAYVNNNSQGMNNSIVLSSSVSERDPGVHIVITKESIGPRNRNSPIEKKKVEFNTISANKLSYEPMVRRRCLKGLLLESSDSDPETPRRHGCRVGCKESGL